MPHASRRLDLHFVPADVQAHPIEGARAFVDALRQRRVLEPDGWPGPEAAWLVGGGFRRIRIDDPGQMVLYANQVGGFRVRCPETGGNVVAPFQKALASWRAGGPRRFACVECDAEHALESASFAPDAAFGRLAVVAADVGNCAPERAALDLAEHYLGPVRIIARRL